MPIKRRPSRDPWPWPSADPPTEPIPRPPDFDTPDPATPLFDACWALSGLSGRHALTPTREVPMPRHSDADRDGVLDHLQDIQHGIPVTLADPDPVDVDAWTGVTREMTPADLMGRTDG